MPHRRPAKAPPRRTQGERSADTRRRILDAALSCLSRQGYAGTTTLAVAARARVSRGAQLHHFPTRAALISAAVQHLFDRLREDYERSFAAVPPGADRVRAAVGLLWSAFQDEALAAVLELGVAARTDAELARALRPISDAHHRHVVRLARNFFPEAAAGARRFEETLQFVLDALQGMAVRRLLRPDDPSLASSLARLETLAEAALSPRSGS